MHFRKARKTRSNYIFNLGHSDLEYVNEYKYLGLIFNEHLNYVTTTDILTKSAGRAFNSCLNKFKTIKNMGYQTYTKLFETCVNPVMHYSSEVWGFKNYATCDTVQLRAMRFFLGVHKHTPSVGVRGEFGWLKPRYERWRNMCRYWNRLLSISNSRMLYKIFRYDYEICKNNWSSELKAIFAEIDNQYIFTGLSHCSLEEVETKLIEVNKCCWDKEITQYSKLRTYVIFKSECKAEKYLSMCMTRRQRSLYAQLRLGVLPLRLETGRFKGEKEIDRICVLCKSGDIENEKHFLFKCSLYENERAMLYKKADEKCPDFKELNENDKIHILMTQLVSPTSKFVQDAFIKRRNTLYV